MMHNGIKTLLLLTIVWCTSLTGWAAEVGGDPMPRTYHEIWLTRELEGGVVERSSFAYGVRFQLQDPLFIDALVRSSFLEGDPAAGGNNLFGLGFGFRVDWLRSEADFILQHEAWPAWQVTENRLAAFWKFRPFPIFSAQIGLYYRTPQYNSTRFDQIFAWPWANSELSTLYRLELGLYEGERFKMDGFLGNYDRMRIYAWDNMHIAITPAWYFNDRFSAALQLGVALKGVSGGILSLSQWSGEMGLRYVY